MKPASLVVKNPPASAETQVWEDPTYHKEMKPVNQNYWASALEPRNCNHGTHVSKLMKPISFILGPKGKRNERKNKQMGPNSTSKLLNNKETINKIKRQSTEWEKILANDVTNKGLLSKIYK